VVAANSVVTKDVPPMTIVAGSPARIIRSRDAVARPTA
jgi:acetyltransferase-like isoleucine patch superfamily enzyme